LPKPAAKNTGKRRFDRKFDRLGKFDKKFGKKSETPNAENRKNTFSIAKAPEPEDDWIETLQLEGRKPVLEALENGKPIDRLLIRKEKDGNFNGTLKVIAAKARDLGVVVQGVDRAKLDALSQSNNHQGIIACCPAKEYVSISDILAIAAERGEQPFIIVLDGITDPHNLGAILRSAEAGGVHGVVIPKRRAVGLTGAVAKTSAGAIEYIAVARVTNTVRCIEELKKAGLWVICGTGGHSKNSTNIHRTELSGPIALVVGAESVGVSRLVQEKSDFTVHIPMFGHIESLNASVACAIMIYEVVRNRAASVV